MVLEKKRVIRMKPQPEMVKANNGLIMPKMNKCTEWFRGVHLELFDAVVEQRFGNFITDFGFINIYLSDHAREVLHDEHLYYLFSPNKFTRNFDRYCEYLENLELFEEMYDVRPTDMGKVMLVMKLPDYMKKSREHFINGNYSLFPEEYMKTRLKSTNQFDIWSKSPDVRKDLETKLNVKLDKEAELDSIPNLETVVFNYNKEIKV